MIGYSEHMNHWDGQLFNFTGWDCLGMMLIFYPFFGLLRFLKGVQISCLCLEMKYVAARVLKGKSKNRTEAGAMHILQNAGCHLDTVGSVVHIASPLPGTRSRNCFTFSTDFIYSSSIK